MPSKAKKKKGENKTTNKKDVFMICDILKQFIVSCLKEKYFAVLIFILLYVTFSFFSIVFHGTFQVCFLKMGLCCDALTCNTSIHMAINKSSKGAMGKHGPS